MNQVYKQCPSCHRHYSSETSVWKDGVMITKDVPHTCPTPGDIDALITQCDFDLLED